MFEMRAGMSMKFAAKFQLGINISSIAGCSFRWTTDAAFTAPVSRIREQYSGSRINFAHL